MVDPIDPNTTALLVPLLLVIVERFSTIARAITDRRSTYLDAPPIFMPTDANTDQDSVYLGIPPVFAPSESDTESDGSADVGVGFGQWLPRLGQLNILHATNMAVLTAAFLLVNATETGLVRNVLVLVVVVIWLQLPLLEIKNYGELRENRPYPLELYVHLVGTLLVVWYVAASDFFEPGLFLTSTDLLSVPMQSVLGRPQQILGVFGLVVLVLATTGAFLELLERQISDE